MIQLYLDILSILCVALISFLLICEIKRDLMMLQQNSYRKERYMRWLRQSGDTTSYMRLIALFLILFCLAVFKVKNFAIICVSLFSIYGIVTLLKKKYKKPLVFTKRAIRIFVVTCILSVLIVSGALTASHFGILGTPAILFTAIITILVLYSLSHFLIISAVVILSPYEKHINNGYYKNAQRKLQSIPELKIIGITGSYGKTSTKHYLHRILSESYETLMTPGSFNTTLGVIRTINEYLKPYHQVFIVEMGAKQNGDIKEICDLVHPEIGILTAVGPQHLETFRSFENVVATKFELIESLPKNGYAVLNNDYPAIAEKDIENCSVFQYTCEDTELPNGYEAFDITYNVSGTAFKLRCPDGQVLEFETQLLGRHNISNLIAAIAVARILGIAEEKISFAVNHIEAVEHRLSVKKLGNGLTILDDAFNSNPAGASMAVEVLSQIKTGRRFIITPGMIELGNQQYDRNYELGKQIAQTDIEYVAIVGSYNKEAINQGLIDGEFKNEIQLFDTFLEANAWMISIAKPGDVILIENDLPDTFK